MYNIVIIYIIFLYKINNGKFHLYFLIMIFLGYYCSYKITSKLLKNVKLRLFIEKIKSRCYTKHNKR